LRQSNSDSPPDSSASSRNQRHAINKRHSSPRSSLWKACQYSPLAKAALPHHGPAFPGCIPWLHPLSSFPSEAARPLPSCRPPAPAFQPTPPPPSSEIVPPRGGANFARESPLTATGGCRILRRTHFQARPIRRCIPPVARWEERSPNLLRRRNPP
jgi:hypothetical protein